MGKGRISPWSIYPGALMGWVMDAFDLSMMFLLVPVLAGIFFPSNYGLAIIGTWSIYTTTFIFRPVGGAIFGRVGDRIGRKNAMVITLLGLGLVIFATGFLPTYAAIGIAAPLLLFLFRIITGIFAGGEYGNSSAILMESVGVKKRGIWGGRHTKRLPDRLYFSCSHIPCTALCIPRFKLRSKRMALDVLHRHNTGNNRFGYKAFNARIGIMV